VQTMRNKILKRLERFGQGKAFSAKDFLDIASRTTADVALTELATDGTIRRIRRGPYDVPKINPALGGKLSPDTRPPMLLSAHIPAPCRVPDYRRKGDRRRPFECGRSMSVPIESVFRPPLEERSPCG